MDRNYLRFCPDPACQLDLVDLTRWVSVQWKNLITGQWDLSDYLNVSSSLPPNPIPLGDVSLSATEEDRVLFA